MLIFVIHWIFNLEEIRKHFYILWLIFRIFVGILGNYLESAQILKFFIYHQLEENYQF